MRNCKFVAIFSKELNNTTHLKKTLRIAGNLLLAIIALLFALWILLQTPFFQTWIINNATVRLSQILGTEVKVGKAYLGWLNRLQLKDVVVYDEKKDTLLSAGTIQINTIDWLIFRDTVEVKNIALEDVYVHLYRNDSIWNYSFLEEVFAGPGQNPGELKPAQKTQKPIVLSFNLASVSNLHLLMEDRWKGRISNLEAKQIFLDAKMVNPAKKQYIVEYINLESPRYVQARTKGLWSAEDSIAYRRRTDSLKLLKTIPERWNKNGLYFAVDEIHLSKGKYGLVSTDPSTWTNGYFDPKNIVFDSLNGKVADFSFLDDTIRANIQLTGSERSGLQIRNLNAIFRMHPQLMEFDNLDLQLNNSRLGPYYAMTYPAIDRMEDFVDSVVLNMNVRNSVVDIQDVAFFAPALKKVNQQIRISGNALGTVSGFTVSSLDASTGNSRLLGQYTMRGLPDVQRSRIEFLTNGSVVDPADIEPWAPELRRLRSTPVYNLGPVTLNGSFAGTVFDFNLKGHLQANQGAMDADLKMVLSGPNKGFTGIISNADIHAGSLLDVSKLGRVTFNGVVSSSGLSAADAVKIKGDIHTLQFDKYTYHDLSIDGTFLNSELIADIRSRDENLNGDITTRLDFKESNRNYVASGALVNANLRALGITEDSLRFSGLFDVNFKGSKIDDFVGYARMYDASLYDGIRQLSFDSLVINSVVHENGNKTLEILTNEASVRIDGKFNLSDLPNGFLAFLHHYYPSIFEKPRSLPKNQDFTFDIETKNIDPYLYLIDPNLRGLSNSTLKGVLNTDKFEMLLNVDAPFVGYKNFQFRNVSLRGNGSDNWLYINGGIDNLVINDSLNIPNVSLGLVTSMDTTQLKLTTRMGGALGDAVINGMFIASEGGFEALFRESEFILNNKKWVISSEGSISMRNGYLFAQGVEITSGNQKLLAYSVPSDEHNWNDIHVEITELNLGDFLPYFTTEPRLEGLLTGKVVVEDPLRKPLFHMDLAAHNFYFNNDSVGLVTVRGNYNTTSGAFRGNIDSKNPLYDFGGEVAFDVKPDGKSTINTVINLRNERISLLNNYLSTVFKNMDGYANGTLQIVGSLKAPRLVGEVRLSQAQFTVLYTGVTYFVDSATLKFGENFLDLGTINLKDAKDRTGTVKGIMYHHFFDSLSFYMNVASNGMEVLNTNPKDNDLFYGKAVGAATFSLNGPINNLYMKVAGNITDSSHIIIANREGKTSGEADYLSFKTYGVEMTGITEEDELNLHIDMELTTNPLCQIDVIMDEVTGDVISARGNGNLRIRTGTTEETVMRGRYNIESGNYNFSFQTLIKKPFELVGGENSFIEWNGDPYTASMRVQARYIANNISFSDLLNTSQSRDLLDPSAANYKGDVYVNALLTGQLMQPNIEFSIEFPPGSPMRNNLSAMNMLQQIENDKSEMLRQVTYLIVFRSFAPYKQGTGTRIPGTELAINTLSDLISDEMGKILTNVFQEILGDKSLNVDFNTAVYNSNSLVGGEVVGSAGYDRVNFNFMLRRSYLNNRIVVNVGSDFDVGRASASYANAGFQFLPNISVEFILTKDRKLRAILFKRDNIDFIGRRNRAGVSLSYRQDFEDFLRLRGRSKNQDDILILRKEEEDQDAGFK